jgi:hypothetical protein
VPVSFSFEVSGPLGTAHDVLTISADVTLVVDRGAGLIPHEAPLQIVAHQLERTYTDNHVAAEM